MMDTCAEYTRAIAYIARHQLVWSRDRGGTYNIYNPENAGWTWGTVSESVGIHGIGKTLYATVLSYQERSGIGWNS